MSCLHSTPFFLPNYITAYIHSCPSWYPRGIQINYVATDCEKEKIKKCKRIRCHLLPGTRDATPPSYYHLHVIIMMHSRSKIPRDWRPLLHQKWYNAHVCAPSHSAVCSRRSTTLLFKVTRLLLLQYGHAWLEHPCTLQRRETPQLKLRNLPALGSTKPSLEPSA